MPLRPFGYYDYYDDYYDDYDSYDDYVHPYGYCSSVLLPPIGPLYHGPCYWTGWVGFNPLWASHMSWMDTDLYGSWHDWQDDIRDRNLIRSDRRRLLRNTLQSRLSSRYSSNQISKYADMIMDMEGDLGADEYGHVNTNTGTTTTEAQHPGTVQQPMRPLLQHSTTTTTTSTTTTSSAGHQVQALSMTPSYQRPFQTHIQPQHPQTQQGGQPPQHWTYQQLMQTAPGPSTQCLQQCQQPMQIAQPIPQLPDLQRLSITGSTGQNTGQYPPQNQQYQQQPQMTSTVQAGGYAQPQAGYPQGTHEQNPQSYQLTQAPQHQQQMVPQTQQQLLPPNYQQYTPQGQQQIAPQAYQQQANPQGQQAAYSQPQLPAPAEQQALVPSSGQLVPAKKEKKHEKKHWSRKHTK